MVKLLDIWDVFQKAIKPSPPCDFCMKILY